MKKASRSRVLEVIAVNNGYKDATELLKDYNFVPTVLTPKHRKFEIVSLLLNYIRQ